MVIRMGDGFNSLHPIVLSFSAGQNPAASDTTGTGVVHHYTPETIQTGAINVDLARKQ